MKAIKNASTNHTMIINADQKVMLAEFKAMNVKFGAASLASLLSGERDTVNGYTVIDVEESNTAGATASGDQTAGGGSEGAGDQGTNQNRREGDDQGNQAGGGDTDNGGGDQGSSGTNHTPIPGNQGGTHEQHVNAGRQSHKNDGDSGNSQATTGDGGGDTQTNANTNQPAAGGSGNDQSGQASNTAPAGSTSNATTQGDGASGNAQASTGAPPAATGSAPAATTTARKTYKAADARTKVKPVRKGTKIADGLALLLKGCTSKELEAANVSDDTVDFVNRRVTKRGYGIKLDGDKIMLVLPAGQTDISYNATGGDGAAAGSNLPGQPGNTAAAGNNGGHPAADDANKPAAGDGDEPATNPAPAADAPADQAANA